MAYCASRRDDGVMHGRAFLVTVAVHTQVLALAEQATQYRHKPVVTKRIVSNEDGSWPGRLAGLWTYPGSHGCRRGPDSHAVQEEARL